MHHVKKGNKGEDEYIAVWYYGQYWKKIDDISDDSAFANKNKVEKWSHYILEMVYNRLNQLQDGEREKYWREWWS